MGFRLVAILFWSSFCFCSLVQSRCTRGCELAIASYYVGSGSNLYSIAQYMNTDIYSILQYNRDTVPNQDSLLVARVNVPFSCDCINADFLGHVFNYTIKSQDTYELIADVRYANLTTGGWIQRINSYDGNQIPDNARINVTLNCSCGDSSISKDYGLFVTYPLRQGETLDSVSSEANLSSELIRRYNPNADFSVANTLLYIPARDENGNYPSLRTSSGVSGEAIGGIAIAVVAGVLLLAGCVYYGLHRNKVGGSDSSGLPGGASPGLGQITVDKSVEFTYEELSRATDEFSLANKIGQGGFGAVYYAELRGQKVAIKKMDMQASKEFLAELKVLTHVHHLNLVHLIGYCVEVYEYIENGNLSQLLHGTGFSVEGSLFLVYEYIENGNLSQHLRGKGQAPLPWSIRVQIALDSARGLEYIHEYTVPIYIHRDIKSENILIDKNFHGKVADFGLTKLTKVGSASLPSRLVGTFGYMPPEYGQCGNVSPKVDVYAFGVVLYELISAKEAIVKAQDSSMRGLASLMAQLAKACTHENPQLRPSMRSVVVGLMTLSSVKED